MVEPGHSITLENWQDGPFNRWAFLHVDQFVPTARVSTNSAPSNPFQTTQRSLLDLPVARIAGDTCTVADVLDETETDAFLVLHDGVLVTEEYRDFMSGDSTHLLMSVTKSFIGAVTGILAEGGLLDLDGPITEHVPEVIGHGYEGATVRHLLDMRSGIAFSEEYLNPDAEVRLLQHAASWRPYRRGSPTSTYDYLSRLPAAGPHGGGFHYRSCETDILGWVCERASGTDMATLLSTLIWQRLGMEHDAYVAVDPVGAVVHDGGLCASARDLARFGQLLLDNGQSFGGDQVLPERWAMDVIAGASDGKDAFTATSSFETGMPGGHYRHQLWVPFPDGQVILGLGIHGQMLYVDLATRTVGVKLSSWPIPQSATRFHNSLNTFRSIAAHLSAFK